MLSGYDVTHVRATEDRVRAGLPDGELMQRAATGLAEVVAQRAKELGAVRIVILAGPGDNGGDALFAAARLGRDHEHAVQVVVAAERPHPAGLAAVQTSGVPALLVEHPDGPLPEQVALALAEADLVVDGLLGIGGRPGLGGVMAALAREVPDAAYLVAVDLPSGTDPAGLQPPADAVLADETVTFGMLKPVHLLPATERAVGRLTAVDIGVPMTGPPVVERIEPADVAALWPVPTEADHKYSRGVLGVAAGSDDYPGAALLCAATAVESGAGMVRYLGPRRCENLVLAACPEVVPGEGQVQAWVVGPGSPDPEVVRRVLVSRVPCVVDAGALEMLAGLVLDGGPRQTPTLLTPHGGELARLLTALGEEAERADVQRDPLGSARRAAARTGCTVLLKGSTTIVVDPDPAVPVRSQADGPPWLATAGSGDVLAGLAGMLLAAGLAARDAGALAALVHGRAAHRANPGGPVRALGVARALPEEIADLLAV